MMELWPFTNFHDLNLDWIIKTVLDWVKKMQNFVTEMTADWKDMQDDWQEFIDSTYKDQITEILEEHPEWTTTVMDGAITKPKINAAFLKEIINYYVTPQMFGAIGDGVTDDTAALQAAMATGQDVYLGDKTYYVTDSLSVNNCELFNGVLHFKSVSGVVKAGINATGTAKFKNLEIYSDRDQSAVTFTDSVQSSNIIGISCSAGGSVELYNCYLHGLEYGVKADTVSTLKLSINNTSITDSMMPLYCSTSYIDVNNSTFESIASNTLYHPAYMKTADIISHHFNNCNFYSANTSFQYFNDETTATGTAYINNCYFQKHFIDYKGNCVVRASSIEGAVNYGGTYYNCFIATVLTNDNIGKKLYNCAITRYVMCTMASATVELYNCAMDFLNLGQAPVQISAGSVTFANCSIKAAYESNMMRLSGTGHMNLENCMIERPGAANSRIYFTASGSPTSLVIGNTVHANDTNFPTTDGNVVVAYS